MEKKLSILRELKKGSSSKSSGDDGQMHSFVSCLTKFEKRRKTTLANAEAQKSWSYKVNVKMKIKTPKQSQQQ